MFARIASCLMNRAKSSLISFSVIVIYVLIGAAGGLEPPTQPLTASSKPTELHDTPYIYSLIQAAGSHTNLRHTRRAHPQYWTCNQDRISIRSVCCDVIATIQPSILTTSLGLALLPICSVCCCDTATVTHQLVMLADSELTSFLPAVLTDWLPSLSTPSVVRSLSMPFQLMVLHDPFGLLATTLAIVFSVNSAYLPGLLAARPSAFVEGEGFEPPMFPFRAVTLHFAIVASALAASLSFSFGYLSANLPVPYVAMA